jgi:hypothetical protein
MRCGDAIESFGSEWFRSALTATISTTPMSHLVGAFHPENPLGRYPPSCFVQIAFQNGRIQGVRSPPDDSANQGKENYDPD